MVKKHFAKASLAKEIDWKTEYLDSIISVKVVDNVDEAISHIQKYGTNGNGARMQYVHSPDQRTQIPYNIVDIARAFPIDFAFIDGISAIDKGEGPWVKNISYATPGVLVAGDNAVAARRCCWSAKPSITRENGACNQQR